jgi:hypothetical protein
MALLHGGLYDAVRAALDTSLTEDDVSSTTIAHTVYGPAAEAEVLRRAPGADALPAATRELAVRAAVWLCAALLAPAVPQLLQERIGPDALQYAQIDWQARAALLRARADAEIAAVLNTQASATYAMPTLFATAAGTRGR